MVFNDEKMASQYHVHFFFFSDFQEVVQDKVSKALVVFRDLQITLGRAISVEWGVEGKSQRTGWPMSEDEEEESVMTGKEKATVREV